MTTSARPPKPTIKMELMFVEPEFAKQWLGNMCQNRGAAEARIVAMANDITSGEFIPTHQGIAFDVNGMLCDGQHRLAAIVRAQKGAWLFVARDVPVKAMAVIDSGRARNIGDRMEISRGWEAAKPITAAARIIAEIEVGKQYAVSDSVVMRVADRERDNILWATSKKVPRITCYAPCAAALAYARPVIDPNMAESFYTALVTGADLRVGSPILALRAHLDKLGSHRRVSADRHTDFRRTLEAIRRHVFGEDAKILRDSGYGLQWVVRARVAKGLPAPA